MRNTRGNDDYIAFGQMLGLATLNLRPAPLARGRVFPSDHRPAGHNGRLSVNHINHVSFFVMDFDLTGCVAMRALDNQIRLCEQDSPFASELVTLSAAIKLTPGPAPVSMAAAEKSTTQASTIFISHLQRLE